MTCVYNLNIMTQRTIAEALNMSTVVFKRANTIRFKNHLSETIIVFTIPFHNFQNTILQCNYPPSISDVKSVMGYISHAKVRFRVSVLRRYDYSCFIRIDLFRNALYDISNRGIII